MKNVYQWVVIFTCQYSSHVGLGGSE